MTRGYSCWGHDWKCTNVRFVTTRLAGWLAWSRKRCKRGIADRISRKADFSPPSLSRSLFLQMHKCWKTRGRRLISNRRKGEQNHVACAATKVHTESKVFSLSHFLAFSSLWKLHMSNLLLLSPRFAWGVLSRRRTKKRSRCIGIAIAAQRTIIARELHAQGKRVKYVNADRFSYSLHLKFRVRESCFFSFPSCALDANDLWPSSWAEM